MGQIYSDTTVEMDSHSTAEIPGNICEAGLFNTLTDHVTSGQYPLLELFRKHTFRCTSKTHTKAECFLYGCQIERDGHWFSASLDDIYKWATENKYTLAKRPKIRKELTLVSQKFGILPAAAALWPVIQLYPRLSVTKQVYALAASPKVTPDGRKILHKIGIAKPYNPTNTILTLDARLYNFALTVPHPDHIKLVHQPGPYTKHLIYTIYCGVKELPVEMQLLIIEMALGLIISPTLYSAITSI